ncbi:MAG: 5-formyltetrahydrofolate cyclo-ligase [Oscillospiraceae bacterium]
MENADKKALRNFYKGLRNSISKEDRTNKSLHIINKVIKTKQYNEAKIIMAYASFGSEVETTTLIHNILNSEDSKKNLVLPLCNMKNHEIIPVYITALSQLKQGNYGILEPDFEMVKNGEIKIAQKNDIDLCIVPALCFDKSGNRLGYGGGYYDRFLEGYENFSIGISYIDTICKSLPCEKFDATVDMVITD